MSTLSLFLLGTPRIEQDGKYVYVDTRKAIALFVFLAITRQPQSRERLAAFLWPESDLTHAHAALRRTLSELHTALGGQGLLIRRETVELVEKADIWVDVQAFRQYIAECRAHSHPTGEMCPDCLRLLSEAAVLYRDDFLSGFNLRDSAEFDDWQFFQADTLRRELAWVLEMLVNCTSNAGNYEAAIQHARRWLALDPLHEPAHRQLMLIYAYAGQRNAALRQYQDCVRILEQELSTAPLEETTRLYQAIKEERIPARLPRMTIQQVDLSPQVAFPVSAPVKANPVYPLVGRSAEWLHLEQIYSEERRGGTFVVLEGEAGVGKTRLAEEFMISLRSQGSFVISARCYEGEVNLAYGPFIDALRGIIEAAGDWHWWDAVPAYWLSEAARLLPELAVRVGNLPPAAPVDIPGAQSRFFESISQVLLAVCAGCKQSVLFLDDLHWADESSLDLLFYLVRRVHGRSLHILGTWRSENVPPDHRLRGLLAEEVRSGAGYQIPLSRLDPEAVAELVGKAVQGEKAYLEQVSQRLYRETEGLPFFIVEYLAGIAGELVNLLPDEWSLPFSVRDLLRSRLKGASETARQVLQTSAVLGRSFDFEVLRQVSGRTQEETVAALEELIAKGLIQEAHPGEATLGDGSDLVYDFSHAKIRSWVYEETGLARRRALHVRAAEALSLRARLAQKGQALAGQIAFHYKQAGRAKEAAEYYRLAGEYARDVYANADALVHFKDCSDSGTSRPGWIERIHWGLAHAARRV